MIPEYMLTLVTRSRLLVESVYSTTSDARAVPQLKEALEYLKLVEENMQLKRGDS